MGWRFAPTSTIQPGHSNIKASCPVTVRRRTAPVADLGVFVNYEIRRATLDDATAFSEMAAQSFRDTFLADNSFEDVENYIAQTYTPALQAADIQDSRKEVWLAVIGTEVAGYVQLKDGEVETCVKGPKPCELQRIYVARAFHGRGLAQQLMEITIQRARLLGFQTLWLGVWEHNQRALKFYRKFGYEVVGDHVFVLGKDAQTDLILAKDIRL
jgi:ribosomal protein S18 acetylase RimI-like enzyme